MMDEVKEVGHEAIIKKQIHFCFHADLVQTGYSVEKTSLMTLYPRN